MVDELVKVKGCGVRWQLSTIAALHRYGRVWSADEGDSSRLDHVGVNSTIVATSRDNGDTSQRKSKAPDT